MHIGYHYRIGPSSDRGAGASTYRLNAEYAGASPSLLLLRGGAALEAWQRSLDQGHFGCWNEFLAQVGYHSRIEAADACAAPSTQPAPSRGPRADADAASAQHAASLSKLRAGIVLRPGVIDPEILERAIRHATEAPES